MFSFQEMDHRYKDKLRLLRMEISHACYSDLIISSTRSRTLLPQRYDAAQRS